MAPSTVNFWSIEVFVRVFRSREKNYLTNLWHHHNVKSLCWAGTRLQGQREKHCYAHSVGRTTRKRKKLHTYKNCIWESLVIILSCCTLLEQWELNKMVTLEMWYLQPQPLLFSHIRSRQCHLQLSALIQGGNLQLQQDVMSWPEGTTARETWTYPHVPTTYTRALTFDTINMNETA